MALRHHRSSRVWSGLCVLCIKTSLPQIQPVYYNASVFALFILDGIFDDSQASDWTEEANI